MEHSDITIKSLPDDILLLLVGRYVGIYGALRRLDRDLNARLAPYFGRCFKASIRRKEVQNTIYWIMPNGRKHGRSIRQDGDHETQITHCRYGLQHGKTIYRRHRTGLKPYIRYRANWWHGQRHGYMIERNQNHIIEIRLYQHDVLVKCMEFNRQQHGILMEVDSWAGERRKICEHDTCIRDECIWNWFNTQTSLSADRFANLNI